MISHFYKYKDFLKKYKFAIIMGIITIFRFLIILKLPVYARDAGGGDEYLMLTQAENIISGNWLGEYDYLTLSKGFVFPLFLAACNFIGISYTFGLTLFYVFACLYFLHVVKMLTKNKVIWGFVYIFLIFNPVSFCNSYFQFVYRTTLTVPQVLILFSAGFSLYLDIYYKDFINPVHLVAIIVDIILMMNNREDSIWVLPFVIVLSLICLFTYYKKKRKTIMILACLIPIFSFPLSTLIASTINYYHYGVFLSNDLSSGSFPKVFKDLMSIDIGEEKLPPYSSLSKKQVYLALDNSPRLNELREYLDHVYDDSPLLWAGREPEDREFEENLLQWVLRGAAVTEGYYDNAETAELYWEVVHDELDEAFKTHKLKKKFIVPSMSIPVWHKDEDYLLRWIDSFTQVYKNAAKFDNVYIHMRVEPSGAGIDDALVRRYEAITNNFAIKRDRLETTIIGWIFSTKCNIKVGVASETGENLGYLQFSDSSDIKNGFPGHERYTTQCRFSYNTDSKVKYLNVYDEQNHIIQIIDMNDYYANYDEANGLNYAFDIVRLNEVTHDDFLPSAEKSLKIINPIISIYRNLGLLFNVITIFFIIFCFVIYIITKDKNLKKKLSLSLLFTLSILLSIIVYLIPMSLINFAYFSVNGYISALFILQAMLCICTLLCMSKILK